MTTMPKRELCLFILSYLIKLFDVVKGFVDDQD